MDSEKIVKYAPLSNGETYAYREAGSSKDVIIFIHGNLSSSYYYEHLLPKYADKYRAIAPDLRGFGHSTCNNPPKSIEDFVEDIKLFMDFLKINSCVLMGWCMGGGVVMKFVAIHPDYVYRIALFHSITLEGLPAYVVDKSGHSTSLRAKTMEDVLQIPKVIEIDRALTDQDKDKVELVLKDIYFSNHKKPSKEQLDAYTAETLLQKSYSIPIHLMNQFNISTENNKITSGTAEMSKISCEILVISGSNDKVCGVYDQLHLGKTLENISQVKIFQNCGHFCMFEYPEEIVDITKWFLNSE